MISASTQELLLVALPYASILVFITGIVWRYRSRFTITSLSSQFLESRWLAWGSVPFHLGIVILFLGHLIPVILPAPWEAMVSNHSARVVVEAIGMAAASLCLIGLVFLFVRRVGSRAVQPNSTVMDLVILGVLLFQVSVGLGVAALHRWGSLWAVGTTTPYLWSLLTLRPDPALVAGMPPLMKLHLAGAWVVLGLVPFTRLVHMFTLPLQYLLRPPQKVVWASTRRRIAEEKLQGPQDEGRRLLLRGAIGVGAAGVLLSAGVLGKIFQYFRGPQMTLDEEASLLRKRLGRLETTAEQRQLQLERMRNAYIHVARLGDLSRDTGTYFIDYEMRPALAFRNAEGLPHLISAKCTHLGCTVGKDVDPEGRILCPCHISYFKLSTGRPEPGSPAKEPLPTLGWVLREPHGNIVARRSPDGKLEGRIDPEVLEEYEVWIARAYEEGQA